MPDTNQVFWWLVVMSIFVPAFVAQWIASRRPTWRRPTVLAISTLAIPLMNLAFCGFVSVLEWMSPDDCDEQRCLPLLAWFMLPAMGAMGCGLIGWLGALLATQSTFDRGEPE